MNKIEKLIAELCPQGVVFKELGEVCDVKNGYTPSKVRSEYWTNGTIPWFRMEDIRENGRILNNSIQHITSEAVKGGRLFPANSVIMATTATIGEHALITIDSLANQQFTYLSIKTNYSNKLDAKFFFYYCYVLAEWCKSNTNSSNFPSVNMNGFKKFKIPIPPLTIQKEIVNILDKFTHLEANLEAELVARKKQYEYYREKLLTFEDEVERKALGEIGKLVGGSGLPKTDFTDSGTACIHYGQIYTHYGVHSDKTISFVSLDSAQKLKKVNQGDLIITKTSENVEDVCKTVAWLGNDEIVTGGHTAILKHKQNPKYLSYYINGAEEFQIQKRKFTTGVKVKDVSLKNLGKIKIPIPPLSKQKEIVVILDKFDALVNDISIGIPAEIAARKKQYEYYRNKLLTFQPIIDKKNELPSKK